jgi:diacylglycerol kinase (ATP)
MRYWLITNLQAGNGAESDAYWRERLIRAGVTEPRVRDIADDAWEGELGADDIVLAAGGDGTVNRVAQACLEQGAILGVLPSGTANDFARNLGLPEDADALCELIARAPVAKFDVGWINGRLFLNVVHVGLGTLPTTQASSHLKRWLGRFSYVAVLLRLHRIGLMRGFKATIAFEDGRLEERWLSIAIASGTYFGGGQQMPGASPHDGRLTLAAVRPRPWWQLMRAYVVARLIGRTSNDDDSVAHFDSTGCRIAFRYERLVTADGESLGPFSELELRAEAAALRVIADTP